MTPRPRTFLGRVTRREALRIAGTTLGVLLAPPLARAAIPRNRTLRLFALNTGERLQAEYVVGGRYQRDALDAVEHLMRDHHSGDVHPIDPALLDLMYALSARLETREPLTVVCGYRSPATNRAKLAAGRRVARNSFHLTGRAVDLRVPGRPVHVLRRAALALARGGVGYYPRNGFVHVDVGPRRSW